MMMLVTAAALGGGLAFLVFCWGAELWLGRSDRPIRLSTQEKQALERCDRIHRQFSETGLTRMSRCDIFRAVTSIWKSSRLIALRSGRLGAAFGLAALWTASLAVSLKSLFAPRAHDLRLLLGLRDTITYLAIPRARPPFHR